MSAPGGRVEHDGATYRITGKVAVNKAGFALIPPGTESAYGAPVARVRDTGQLFYTDPDGVCWHAVQEVAAAAPADGELRQDIVVEDDEDPWQVARSLIGVKGKAALAGVVFEPGAQWPTAVYRGTLRELAAVQAKASGSAVGRPAGSRNRR